MSAWAVTVGLSDGSLDRMRMESPDLRAWVLVMVVQSIPYLSAVAASIVSALPLPATLIGSGYRTIETDEEFASIVDAPRAPPPAPPASDDPAAIANHSQLGDRPRQTGTRAGP